MDCQKNTKHLLPGTWVVCLWNVGTYFTFLLPTQPEKIRKENFKLPAFLLHWLCSLHLVLLENSKSRLISEFIFFCINHQKKNVPKGKTWFKFQTLSKERISLKDNLFLSFVCKIPIILVHEILYKANTLQKGIKKRLMMGFGALQ